MRTDVRDALARNISDVGPMWAPFPEPLAGDTYEAMTLAGDDITDNPFRLLADHTADMGDQTLVVVGTHLADGRPGFVLLADSSASGGGHGEDLQDHAVCPPPRGQWSK